MAYTSSFDSLNGFLWAYKATSYIVKLIFPIPTHMIFRKYPFPLNPTYISTDTVRKTRLYFLLTSQSSVCGLLSNIHVSTPCLLCLNVHAPKAYGNRFVYLCVYLYVCNLDFSKVAKNQVLANAVWAQRDNISNLIVLDLLIRALFSNYGMNCSLRTLLWHISDFPDDQSVCSRVPCILILKSIQQLQ